MSFLHPWALLIGVVALGLPILVHRLTRPRPRRLPLSTLRFAREAVHQRRSIHRLRDLLILSLRVLAVGVLAWLFARPLLGERRIAKHQDAGHVARVVMLDVSQSMAATTRGVQAFERARSTAADHLVARPGLQANIIFAGSEPRKAFEGFSSNFIDLRNELSAARPLPERCDVSKALLAAAELLGQTPGGKDHRRELVIVTDLQRANWSKVDFSVLPENTDIQIESVAADQPASNLAVLQVTGNGRAELGRPTRIEVEVGNYSDTPRKVAVDLTLGTDVYRLESMCPAKASTVLAQEVQLQESGWQHGVARLINAEDALSADNVRPFVLEIKPRPVYGLVTREESDRIPSASYYLERALAVHASTGERPEPGVARSRSRGQDASVIRIPPGQVNREMLAGVDLLVVSRPGRLTPAAINLLTAMLRRGKPLVYVACEAMDAENLQSLTRAAGADLRMPVEFTASTNRKACRGLALAEFRRELPPFSIFGPQATDAIEPLRWTRAMDSRALDGGLKDDVLASFADTHACLVWTTCGQGALVVLNADLAESNLPQSAVFVPMMGEMAGHLLNKRKVVRSIHCGEPLTIFLPAEATSASTLTIRGPQTNASSEDLGELVDDPAGVVWRWAGAGAPGVYEVVRDHKPLLAVATGIPSEESDLRPAAVSEVTAHAASGRRIHYRSAIDRRDLNQDDLWTWLGVACVIVMCLELLALRLFKT